LHRGSAYRELTLRTVQQNKPRLRRALKPIVPADIRTDDQLPITLAIAVPVKPVIPRLRRERTGSRNLLFDRCSTRGDCARIWQQKTQARAAKLSAVIATRMGCLLGAEQLGLEHDSEGTALVE
jgi:hypothetical protein